MKSGSQYLQDRVKDFGGHRKSCSLGKICGGVKPYRENHGATKPVLPGRRLLCAVLSGCWVHKPVEISPPRTDTHQHYLERSQQSGGAIETRTVSSAPNARLVYRRLRDKHSAPSLSNIKFPRLGTAGHREVTAEGSAGCRDSPCQSEGVALWVFAAPVANVLASRPAQNTTTTGQLRKRRHRQPQHINKPPERLAVPPPLQQQASISGRHPEATLQEGCRWVTRMDLPAAAGPKKVETYLRLCTPTHRARS